MLLVNTLLLLSRQPLELLLVYTRLLLYAISCLVFSVYCLLFAFAQLMFTNYHWQSLSVNIYHSLLTFLY